MLGACTSNAPQASTSSDTASSTTSITEATTSSQQTAAPTTAAPTTSTSSSTTTEPTPALGQSRPEWLSTIELPLRPGEDNGIAQPTPVELVDRQLWTLDRLDPPSDDRFVSSMESPPPPDVVARSTWRSECPVALDELTYAQVSFYGFDGRFHTGEFILHNDFAGDVVDIFAQLHEQRFPIEEMVVTTQEAVDAHPTGDSNNTASFSCREAVNSGRWSRHAHGGAIDINPFHNPYVKGDLVIPELASAYLDRDRDVPGMITLDIVEMFVDIGWGWGGNWSSASDWMHFSDTGG